MIMCPVEVLFTVQVSCLYEILTRPFRKRKSLNLPHPKKFSICMLFKKLRFCLFLHFSHNLFKTWHQNFGRFATSGALLALFVSEIYLKLTLKTSENPIKRSTVWRIEMTGFLLN